MDKIFLNLGSGRKKINRMIDSVEKQEIRCKMINIDINKDNKPDIVRDLNKGLPFSDNTIDAIFCEHTLEHIQDIRFLIEEIYRVLKPEGVFNYIVPLCTMGSGGFRHFEHIHFFTEDWHNFFCENAAENNYNCNFHLIKQEVVKEPDGTYILIGQMQKWG